MNLIDRRGPPWFDFARRIVIFGLGVYVIIFAVHTSGHDVAFLVTGLILISVIPVENALAALTRKSFKESRDSERVAEQGSLLRSSASDADQN